MRPASLLAEDVSELLVVDNASTDGSVEALSEAHPTVQVLRSGINPGYGAGANRGRLSDRRWCSCPIRTWWCTGVRSPRSARFSPPTPRWP